MVTKSVLPFDKLPTFDFRRPKFRGFSGSARPITASDIFAVTGGPVASLIRKGAGTATAFASGPLFRFGKEATGRIGTTFRKETLNFLSGPLRFTRRKALGLGLTQATIFGLGAGQELGLLNIANPVGTFKGGGKFVRTLQDQDTSVSFGPQLPPTALPTQALSPPPTPEGDIIIQGPQQPSGAFSGPTSVSSGGLGTFGLSPASAGLPLGLLALLFGGTAGFLLGRKRKSKKKKTKKKKKAKKSKTKRNKKTGRFIKS